MTKEEHLLKAIFSEDNSEVEDETLDSYPETNSEKIDYSEYCLQKSLEYISPTLHRIGRLRSLFQVTQKYGKDDLPDIITNNETRMALEHFAGVRSCVEDVYQQLVSVYENTLKTKENGNV